MNKTISTIVIIALTIIIFAVLSLLPIYPLLAEGREISSAGESLYQEWRLVSLGEYFEYSRFARAAWLESTNRIYVVLFIVYTLIVGGFSIVCANRLVNRWRAKASR